MSHGLDIHMMESKTVLLTGGCGGIGIETAKAFSEMGARVLIADINQEEGLKAVECINALHAGQAEFYPTDISDEAAVYHLYHNVLNRSGCDL